MESIFRRLSMIDVKKVLKALLEGGGFFSDLFLEKRRYTLLQLESSRFEKIEHGVDNGVGMRVITPWKTFFASTNSFDDSELVQIARELGKFSRARKGAKVEESVFTKAQYPFEIAKPAEEVEIRNKLDMLQRIDSMARAREKKIKQVRVVYRDTCQQVDLHNSDGTNIEDERHQVVINILVIGEENGEVQTAYESAGGFYGFDFFTDERVEGLVKTVVKRFSGLLGAVEAPMGRKTVVLASEAGGTMIHEAIGHGLEADLALEGLSCYKGMLGEKIGSSLINVVDDATVPHMRGTYAYDDDGIASERTLLVQDGVLKNYLFDRFYALKHDKKPTGNGRRESFRYRPIPRMSNTMILSGKDDPARIIESVDDGVYVVRMGGGQVDTVRGDFVFEIQEGYMIERGKLGRMIKNATMMDNGLQVLQKIDMVGTDLGFGIGTCGKDGQGVPVSDAQPTLRIPGVVVGGKGGGA
jgi:TldD protein